MIRMIPKAMLHRAGNSIALTFITALVSSALLPKEDEGKEESRQLNQADSEAEAA